MIVDQRINGGKWNYLSTVRFNAERNHTVYLAADGPSGYAVIADAVMMYGPSNFYILFICKISSSVIPTLRAQSPNVRRIGSGSLAVCCSFMT